MRQQNIAIMPRAARRFPRTGHWLVMVALAIVTGLGSLLVAGQVARRMAAVGNPAPGRLIDVGGYRLHLHCEGTSTSKAFSSNGSIRVNRHTDRRKLPSLPLYARISRRIGQQSCWHAPQHRFAGLQSPIFVK